MTAGLPRSSTSRLRAAVWRFGHVQAGGRRFVFDSVGPQSKSGTRSGLWVRQSQCWFRCSGHHRAVSRRFCSTSMFFRRCVIARDSLHDNGFSQYFRAARIFGLRLDVRAVDVGGEMLMIAYAPRICTHDRLVRDVSRMRLTRCAPLFGQTRSGRESGVDAR